EPGQRRVIQVVFGYEGFEGAPFALPARGGPVGELGAGRVEGVAAVSFGGGQDLVGGHVDDLGGGVDEPADQPGAGDPVGLRPGTGTPFHDVLRHGRQVAGTGRRR